jgi:hypothetical protein
MTDHDRILRDFLGPPDREVDHVFAEQVRRTVLAEERVKAARRASWTKFGRETLASATLVVLAFLLTSHDALEPLAASVLSPMTLVLLLFGIWTAATLRPASDAG